MDQKYGACNKHGCPVQSRFPVQSRNETIHSSEKSNRRRNIIDAGWFLCTAHELNSVADSSKFHSVVLRHRECRAHCLGVTTLGAVTIQIVIASQPTGVGCVMASLPCRCSVQQLRLARDSSWCESRSNVCHQNVVIFRHGVRLSLSSCHVVAVFSCWFLQVLIVHTLSGLSIHL